MPQQLLEHLLLCLCKGIQPTEDLEYLDDHPLVVKSSNSYRWKDTGSSISSNHDSNDAVILKVIADDIKHYLDMYISLAAKNEWAMKCEVRCG